MKNDVRPDFYIDHRAEKEREDEIERRMDLNARAQESLHDALLHDIAFDLNELKYYRSMHNKHAFDAMCQYFDELITVTREHLEGLKNDYRKEYGKDPNIEDAWRIFNRNRADVNGSRGSAGDTDYDSADTE